MKQASQRLSETAQVEAWKSRIQDCNLIAIQEGDGNYIEFTEWEAMVLRDFLIEVLKD